MLINLSLTPMCFHFLAAETVYIATIFVIDSNFSDNFSFNIWRKYMQVSYLSVKSERLPSGFNGFKIVQVSDLHNKQYGKNQQLIIDKIKEANPDMIAVTGDLIDSRKTDLKKATEFINRAVEIAPVYYVNGNHESRVGEYKALKEKMFEKGINILENKKITFNLNGGSIDIIGLNDPDFYKADADIMNDTNYIIDSKIKELLKDTDKFTLLLSHRPELFEVYVKNNINLALCGHAHGGQIRLPFIGGIYSPGQGFFPNYTEGKYVKNKSTMIVSRGLDNSIFPLRVNNRPELVVITLNAV